MSEWREGDSRAHLTPDRGREGDPHVSLTRREWAESGLEPVKALRDRV